jgi:Ca-activated chloride channel homolog
MIKHAEPETMNKDNQQMALQSVSAKGTVSGLLLEMTIRQKYKNNTKKNIETVYTFPMGWGATLMDMNAEIAGKRLSGLVTEKQEAEEQYERAIQKGDTPIMLEKNSDGIYTANLGNLKPNEEAVIEYTYNQLLRFSEGTVRITLPTTIAPRYGDINLGGIADHQNVDTDFLVEYPFTLALTLKDGMEQAVVECPSHQIQVSKNDESMIVELKRSAFLDRDFILNLSQLANQSFCLVTPDPELGPEGCVVLASFCPPPISKELIQAADIKILVDCSGSMEGDSIASAKRALHHVLSQLNDGDCFSYSQFGGNIKHGFSQLKPVNSFNISAASVLVSNTQANMGGTEIEDALISTFNLKGQRDKANVLLITDGEVWDTSNIIAAAKRSGHRIFAIGVGSSPAETLLREMAELTGGACELVSPREDIEAAIVRMFNRIHLPPAQEIEIDWGTNVIPEWSIGTNTAIFGGNTTHVFAGFKTLPKKAAFLSYQLKNQSGRIGVGSSNLNTITSNNLARLAASQRLQTLPEGDQIALALKYQLITEHTNCVLVHVRENEEKPKELPELQKIALMQAAGWGGAGTVMYEIAYCKASVPAVAAKVTALNAPPVDYSAYDLLRVFRSSREATPPPTLGGDDSSDTKSLLNKGADYYEIPAFLRKQDEKGPIQPPKLFSPIEVIDMANFEIENMRDFSRFTKEISKQEFVTQFKKVLGWLTKSLSNEEAWSVILSWLYMRFDADVDWNDATVKVINTLTNKIDPQKLNAGIQLLEAELKNVTRYYWD